MRRRFSLGAGVSLPPRTDSRKLVRNASFGGCSEFSPVFQGLFSIFYIVTKVGCITRCNINK